MSHPESSLRPLAAWTGPLRNSPGWLRMLVVAVAYFATARLSLGLAFENTNASPVWPPAGLAFAAIVLCGRWAAPGVALGEFAANLLVFLSTRTEPVAELAGVSALLAVGNALATLLGGWLVSARPDLARLPERVGTCVAYVAVAVAMSAVSAAAGSGSLFLGGIIERPIWGTVFLTWLTGDIAGMLVVGPLLLALIERPVVPRTVRRTLETAALILCLFALVLVPFGGALRNGLDQGLVFLLFPAFLWPVFRLGQREATVAVALVALFATWQTVHGVGPFARPTLNESLLLLQGFVSVTTVSIFALGASVSGRQRAERELLAANESLRQRTEELQRLNRRQDALVAERTRLLTESRLAALNMMQDSEASRREAERAARELAEANIRLQQTAAEHEQLAREAREASQAKSDFLATMSHEIRTPMNGVLGFTQLLLEGELSPPQRQRAEIIHRSGDALLTILNDILDFSKIEAGRLSLDAVAFDPRPIVEEVAQLLSSKAQEKGLEVVVACLDAFPPAPLLGDPDRTRQVLTNLLGNAVKFTRSGHIVVEAGLAGGLRERFPRLPEPAFAAGHTLFCVTDTGIGVAADKQHRLFKTFSQADSSTTRQYGGTGLGLAISRRLVELMGGAMGMVSAAGEGSTFWFTLPNAPGVVETSAADVPPSVRPGGVLVVDDLAQARAALGRGLDAWGVANATAANGDEALELAWTKAIVGEPFGTVLLDDLKGQDDAVALAGKLRTVSGMETARIVLMSRTVPSADAEVLAALGLDAVVPKPIASRKALRDAVERPAGPSVVGGGRPTDAYHI